MVYFHVNDQRSYDGYTLIYVRRLASKESFDVLVMFWRCKLNVYLETNLRN